MFDAIHPEKHHIPMLKQLWYEAFGDSDQQIDAFFATAFHSDHCLCIPGDGQIIAAAYWLDCSYAGGKLAYIYAVSTAKKHRGQGLCHSLMQQIHACVSASGYAGSVLVPAEGLDQLYAPLGYHFFGGIKTFSCLASQPVSLRKLSAIEFAALRRQYLPKGSIFQEGESLIYLKTMAQFYEGDDFLLAALKDGDHLIGLELLGNTSPAPAITAAFSCSKGTFRCPGNDHFAMFRPVKDVPLPTYFGFAFD